MGMEGRVAIVTGGGGTIGRAITRRFLEAGMHVVIVGQKREKLDATYHQAGVAPAERVPLAGDVGTEATNQEMVRLAIERFGRLDVIVPCVFWSKTGDLPDVSYDEWNRCLAVTLSSTFLAAKYGFPGILRTAGRGSLIAISSVHGSFPATRYAMYATAKAGLNMLVRALALDYTPRGIRVNAVSPGATTYGGGEWDAASASGAQGIYLIGRYVRPEEIAHTVYFLASDEAAAITGQNLTVEGGGTIGLHDWLANEMIRRAQAAAKA